jgi:hypothetical protein
MSMRLIPIFHANSESHNNMYYNKSATTIYTGFAARMGRVETVQIFQSNGEPLSPVGHHFPDALLEHSVPARVQPRSMVPGGWRSAVSNHVGVRASDSKAQRSETLHPIDYP